MARKKLITSHYTGGGQLPYPDRIGPWGLDETWYSTRVSDGESHQEQNAIYMNSESGEYKTLRHHSGSGGSGYYTLKITKTRPKTKTKTKTTSLEAAYDRYRKSWKKSPALVKRYNKGKAPPSR